MKKDTFISLLFILVLTMTAIVIPVQSEDQLIQVNISEITVVSCNEGTNCDVFAELKVVGSDSDDPVLDKSPEDSDDYIQINNGVTKNVSILLETERHLSQFMIFFVQDIDFDVDTDLGVIQINSDETNIIEVETSNNNVIFEYSIVYTTPPEGEDDLQFLGNVLAVVLVVIIIALFLFFLRKNETWK